MVSYQRRNRSNSWGFTAQIALVVILVCSSTGLLSAQQPPRPVSWDAYQFLMGEWIGEGSGDPGQGSGSCTFAFDLQKTVLVRKNHTDFPATKDRPAFSHDDLMVIYQEGGKTKAVYFDNEQHVINYTVALSKDSNAAIFLSDASPSAPRFRLTYTKMGTDRVKITFDIAPPGKPDSFKTYVEGTARKKK
jgi:hypothetical protein